MTCLLEQLPVLSRLHIQLVFLMIILGVDCNHLPGLHSESRELQERPNAGLGFIA